MSSVGPGTIVVREPVVGSTATMSPPVVTNDRPVSRRSERLGQPCPLRPGVQRKRCPDEESDEDEHQERPQHGRPKRDGTCDDVHGKPPFRGRPGRPLPRSAGLPEHVVEVVRHRRRRQLGHELGQPRFDAIEGGHAYCSPATGGRGGSRSSSIVRRMACSDRWCRDLAVPIGMPSADATSGNGIPR